jgi:hypothetical protein
MVFLAPEVGLEPTTLRLTAECSAIELLRNILEAVGTLHTPLLSYNKGFAFRQVSVNRKGLSLQHVHFTLAKDGILG